MAFSYMPISWFFLVSYPKSLKRMPSTVSWMALGVSPRTKLWSVFSYFCSWNKRFKVNIYLQGKFANCFDRSKSEVFLIVLVVRAHPVLFTSGKLYLAMEFYVVEEAV